MSSDDWVEKVCPAYVSLDRFRQVFERTDDFHMVVVRRFMVQDIPWLVLRKLNGLVVYFVDFLDVVLSVWNYEGFFGFLLDD